MQRFFASPAIGIELTSKDVRYGVVSSKNGVQRAVTAGIVELPGGVVTETFADPMVADRETLGGVLRGMLSKLAPFKTRRIGLCLPDAVFRTQTLEFDVLPKSARDREKLIRWRMEKNASIDMAGTVLRWQTRERPAGGAAVLASLARTGTIRQCEDLFADLGYEVWSVAPASFQAVNYYASALAGRCGGNCGFSWLSQASYSTIILEQGWPRFYRYREVKSGPAAEVAGRLARELDDTLHFYTHRDRQQPAEVGQLFVTGDAGLAGMIAESFGHSPDLKVTALSPGDAVLSAGADAARFAPAWGAGGSL